MAGVASREPEVRDGIVHEVFPATVVGHPGAGGLAEHDFRVLVIAHGTTNDGRRYYSRQVLERAASDRVFDDAKMFLNHSDTASDRARGHRDIREWAATIRPGTVQATERGLEAVAHVHSQQLREILTDPVAKQQVGLSHDSYIRYRQRTIDGREVQAVETITKCNSVDWVPSGNARGRVIESEPEGTDMDEQAIRDLVRESLQSELPGAIRTAVDDRLEGHLDTLVSRVAEMVKPGAPDSPGDEPAPAPDLDEAGAASDQPLETVRAEEVEELRRQNTSLLSKVEALERDRRVQETEREVGRLVAEATGLTQAARQRVAASFEGRALEADDLAERVAEAIEVERAYEQDVLRERGVRTRVSGAGASDASTARDRTREGYESAWADAMRRRGMGEDEIKRLQEVG